MQSGITCVLLDGSMTIPARDNVIKRFHEDPDCRIFLISLKAGGVALNLTVASHVSYFTIVYRHRILSVASQDVWLTLWCKFCFDVPSSLFLEFDRVDPNKPFPQ